MGVVGFIDDSGQRLRFPDVLAGAGSFTTRNGHPVPRPMVATLAKSYRAADHYGDERTVSVTSLIAPVQLKRLEQRHEVYVRPLDNLWAAYGTIAHGLYESGVNAEAGDIVERKLVIERDGFKIGGTFDLLELMAVGEDGLRIYQGRDYKVTSAYGVKKMIAEGVYAAKEDYFWQAQIYRLVAEDPNAVELLPDGTTRPWTPVHIDNWALVAVSRDYNQRSHGVHFGPVELVPVPLLAKERVENYIRSRLMVWGASEMCDDAGLPNCTPEETWQGRRCADYCPVAGRCHQYTPELGMNPDD